MAKKTAGSGPPVKPVIEPVAVLPDYPARTKDKVCLVGFAEGHRHLAPFDDPDWEIWGLNRLHMVQPARYDRWFEVHALGMYLGAKGAPVDTGHLEFLRTFPGPIYLRPQDVGLVQCPSGVPYPVNRVLADFGSYFTNSISWMMAMAIGMGFKEMMLVGVDMAQDGVFVTGSEYRQQRPSCEYFLGIAVGKGMKVHLPPGSDLLKASHLYGLEDGDAILGKRLSRMEELNKRKTVIRDQISQLEGQKAAQEKMYLDQKIALISGINQLDGALQEVIYEGSQLSPPPEDGRTIAVSK